MRILIINTVSINYNGVTDSILQYVKAMDKTDMQIDILSAVASNSQVVDEFERIGCAVIRLENRNKHTIQYVIQLAKLIRKKKYDIVHVHGNSATLAIDIIGALIGGCKNRIAHSHSTSCMQKTADRILRPLFNQVYVHGFACGENAGKWLFGNRKFTIIPNARNLKTYCYNQQNRKKIRERYKLYDAFVVGHIGGFNESKNHKFVLECFKEILNRNENSRLLLIGSGVLYAEIKEYAKQLEIYEKVIFTGSINNVPEMLSAMDIMILPSLYEGMPLVVLEGQASGMPCFLSDCITRECSMTDLVFFLPLDIGSEKWADEILNNRGRERIHDSLNAIKKMKERGYDIEDSAAMLKKMYNSMCKSDGK